LSIFPDFDGKLIAAVVSGSATGKMIRSKTCTLQLENTDLYDKRTTVGDAALSSVVQLREIIDAIYQ